MCGIDSMPPEIPSGGFLEISFCRKGMREYRIGRDNYYLTGGRCLVCRNSGGECCISSSADYQGVTLIIGSGADSAVQEMMCGSADFISSLEADCPRIFTAQGRIGELFGELCSGGEASILRIRSAELVMLIAKSPAITEKLPPETEDKVRSAGRFIRRHKDSHFTIAQLSEHFGVNPTTLKTVFKQVWGCSVYAYSRSRKMFSAAEELSATGKKIIDIAAEAGYSNASKFSGAFRNVIGITPREYRRNANVRMEHN